MPFLVSVYRIAAQNWWENQVKNAVVVFDVMASEELEEWI